MHPTIYKEFRKIVFALKPKGRILEVGAIPKWKSLLAMEELRGEERIGVNIEEGCEYKGFKIVKANGNDMSIFPTNHFDCALSNATIEHDPYFWKTCAEIRRVLRIGGMAIIGAPGFTVDSGLLRLLLSPTVFTLTYQYHGAPKDYYRFSPTAFREVVFEGYRDVVIKSVMMPPRIIGYGFKA
jgi:SAM-dependent methyltransferase